MRLELGAHLGNPEIGPALARELRPLQGLFRDSMDEVGPADRDWGHRHWSHGTDPLSMALGKMRALTGVLVGDLAAKHDLEVSDDLATIVPAQAAWFFDRSIGPDTGS